MKKVLICVGIWMLLFIIAYTLPVQFTGGRERGLMMLFFICGMGMLGITGYFVYKIEKKEVPLWRYMLSNFIVFLLLAGSFVQFFTLSDVYYKRRYKELSEFGIVIPAMVTGVNASYSKYGNVNKTYLNVWYIVSNKNYSAEITLDGDYTTYQKGDSTDIIYSSRHPRVAQKYWR